LPSAPPWESATANGGYLELAIDEIHFSHDGQSETFGKATEKSAREAGWSLLQLAVELIAGVTAAEDVPEFNVCSYQGHWWCRSGNRRLGAFRLAHRFAPERIRRLRVKTVPCDTIFTHGAGPGRRPKLTTYRNDRPGEPCEGRFLLIKETGEYCGLVGASRTDLQEHGADLLSLLPGCAKADAFVEAAPQPKRPATWRQAGAFVEAADMALPVPPLPDAPVEAKPPSKGKANASQQAKTTAKANEAKSKSSQQAKTSAKSSEAKPAKQASSTAKATPKAAATPAAAVKEEKLKAELAAAPTGAFANGAKLQVLLESGWADCLEEEMVQVGCQMDLNSKKFAIQARGAMYAIDMTDPNHMTQTNTATKKIRQLRIVKP